MIVYFFCTQKENCANHVKAENRLVKSFRLTQKQLADVKDELAQAREETLRIRKELELAKSAKMAIHGYWMLLKDRLGATYCTMLTSHSALNKLKATRGSCDALKRL
uniref:Uncharacterized protein n=1 Tax=Tetranychus urticae TaxID=32264 RepID=T1K527_TETUR